MEKKSVDSIKTTRTNQSVDKTLDIIEILVRNGSPMRLSEIVKQCGMPQSTVYRMINALLERGYVLQDGESSLYSLSLKFALLGDMIRARFDIRDVVRPYMTAISSESGGFCYLGVPRGTELVYIDMVSPPGSVNVRMPFVGRRAPLHCSGIGSVILADYPESKLKEYLEIADYTQLVHGDHVDKEWVINKVKEVRAQGYSFSAEHLERGNGSIAAALRNYTGNVVAGISIGGPIEMLTEEYKLKTLPILMNAADEISYKMAYNAIK